MVGRRGQRKKLEILKSPERMCIRYPQGYIWIREAILNECEKGVSCSENEYILSILRDVMIEKGYNPKKNDPKTA